MTRKDFLATLASPIDTAILKKYPYGDIYQLWEEHPELYSAELDTEHRYLAGHLGIDIKAPKGTPVKSCHDGIVTRVQGTRDGQGGLEVWVTSPELEDGRIDTSYSHLDTISVPIGAVVTKGDVLGTVGNTGFVISGHTPFWGDAPAGDGSHLHLSLYEYKRDGANFVLAYPLNGIRGTSDPLPYLTGDLSGLIVALKNMLAYLGFISKRHVL